MSKQKKPVSEKTRIILVICVSAIIIIIAYFAETRYQTYTRTAHVPLGQFADIEFKDYRNGTFTVEEVNCLIDSDYWHALRENGVDNSYYVLRDFENKYYNPDNIYTDDEIVPGSTITFKFKTQSGYDPRFHVYVNCEPFQYTVPDQSYFDFMFHQEYERKHKNSSSSSEDSSDSESSSESSSSIVPHVRYSVKPPKSSSSGSTTKPYNYDDSYDDDKEYWGDDYDDEDYEDDDFDDADYDDNY